MRRFTRLTNAFSKKLENLKAAVALHFAHYNFVSIHSTLRMTPAMAAGVTKELWSITDLIERANQDTTNGLLFLTYCNPFRIFNEVFLPIRTRRCDNK